MKLLNNALEIEIPTHIVQDPIYQIHGSFVPIFVLTAVDVSSEVTIASSSYNTTVSSSLFSNGSF